MKRKTLTAVAIPVALGAVFFGIRHLLLSGYSVGLIMISRAMVARLGTEVRELQSKVDKLESTKN